MRLIYHEGKNFGDALNPIIFNKLLPNFFTDKGNYEFLGIGSILGLKKPQPETKKMIVFSSGFGNFDTSTYGKIPEKNVLKKYDFRCVRGPLTAKVLSLPEKTAVCDGAILLPHVIPPIHANKQYKYSYMPHHGSLTFYPEWKELLQSIDINLIDPRENVSFVLEEIQKSDILISEAMHGAIIADAYRIPWIPIKTNKTINEFKWQDFSQSLDLEFNPNKAQTLFSLPILQSICEHKLKPLQAKPVSIALAKLYKKYQDVVTKKAVLKKFEEVKSARQFLSEEKVLERKKESLSQILDEIYLDYKSLV